MLLRGHLWLWRGCRGLGLPNCRALYDGEGGHSGDSGDSGGGHGDVRTGDAGMLGCGCGCGCGCGNRSGGVGGEGARGIGGCCRRRTRTGLRCRGSRGGNALDCRGGCRRRARGRRLRGTRGGRAPSRRWAARPGAGPREGDGGKAPEDRSTGAGCLGAARRRTAVGNGDGSADGRLRHRPLHHGTGATGQPVSPGRRECRPRCLR